VTLRPWTMLAVLLVLASTPALALAALCFDVSGLPEAASLNLTVLAAPPGTVGVALVGEAQGVCGLGQPVAPVQGAAILDSNGAARVGLKIQADRPGCSAGDAELVLPAPFTSGSGRVRLPEGSATNVTLAFDATGQACLPRTARVTACASDDTRLCLLQNRFTVTATAAVGAQPVTLVPGQAVKGSSSESGFFSFSPSKVADLQVKVLDSRGINTFFWVSITPLTNVAYTVSVNDTLLNHLKIYTNPLVNPQSTQIDTTAFAATP
jgi:hypothetical protein